MISSCQKKGNIEKNLTVADEPVIEKTSSKSETQSFGISKNSINKWNDIDNPAKDGWQTEALAKSANEQLKNLGKIF